MKNWYLIHAKPGEDRRAEANLDRQGYNVFLSRVRLRKRRRQGMATVTESLFPRYLLIELDDLAQNWSPIRSTPGVAALVCLGGEATMVAQKVVGVVASAASGADHHLRPGANVQAQVCTVRENSYGAGGALQLHQPGASVSEAVFRKKPVGHSISNTLTGSLCDVHNTSS